LVKTYNGVVDLVASLATSAGFPIGNKKAKLSMTEAASSDIVQAMIDRCLADVSANLLIWGRKE
jgi:hypothetical protein